MYNVVNAYVWGAVTVCTINRCIALLQLLIMNIQTDVTMFNNYHAWSAITVFTKETQ